MLKPSFPKTLGAIAAIVTLAAGVSALHAAPGFSLAPALSTPHRSIVLAGDTGFNPKGAAG
jgi:hypothetical protein